MILVMKSIIKLLSLVVLLSVPYCTDAQNYNHRNTRNYEVQNLGVATDGTKTFKIYVTHRNKNKAIAEAKKAAVEVVIFRGIPSAGTVSGTPALCSIADEEKNAAYFEKFFEPGGQFLRYINITSDENADITKVKGGYKVGIIVQVMYDNLRKDLENAGITKSLKYGF